MRKKYIILIISSSILLSIGIFILMFFINKNGLRKSKYLDQVAQINKSEESYNSQIISTSTAEEKVSPNAMLIFKIKYNGCNHITVNRTEVQNQDVNKTIKEIKEKYKEWEIEKFSPNEIIFIKEESGICNEHYALRDTNGYLVVYTIDADGKESLKETTEIVTKYLPENDLKKLKDGIKIEGLDNLNATIEDYE